MQAEIKEGKLHITIELQQPERSKTGKTVVIATSHGNQPTTAMVDGKPLIIGVNAYVKA